VCDLLFPDAFINSEVSPFAWLLLIVFIDVAHVYSTLYRTYFDKAVFTKHKTILSLTPLLTLIAGAVLYSLSPLLFWRIAAYLAVFHFIRQQYGFARIYSRKETAGKLERVFDAITIYALAIYPIIHWHMTGPHAFNWFVDGDFLYFHAPALLQLITILYWIIVGVFLIKTLVRTVREKQFNFPKFLLYAGTGISWYAGIIWFEGDLTFTLLNVVSHGIPYMALVWFTGNKKFKTVPAENRTLLSKVFQPKWISAFVGVLILFAFVEEAIWDVFVWQDHSQFFAGLRINASAWLPILVPLLSVPQFTHYVIDGFIWKIRSDDYQWSKQTLQ
jgi:hypothetical protein